MLEHVKFLDLWTWPIGM